MCCYAIGVEGPFNKEQDFYFEGVTAAVNVNTAGLQSGKNASFCLPALKFLCVTRRGFNIITAGININGYK